MFSPVAFSWRSVPEGRSWTPESAASELFLLVPGRAFALRRILVETNPVLPAPRAAGTPKVGNSPAGVEFVLLCCFLVRRGAAVSASPSIVVRMPGGAPDCAAACMVASAISSAPTPIGATRNADLAPDTNEILTAAAAATVWLTEIKRLWLTAR
jgi:hypothetical protein